MNTFIHDERHRVFRQLMLGFKTTGAAETGERWAWLEAAHVVGQHDFSLHWASHAAMLRFALQTRDMREAAGQVFRLGLVPLGHLLQRLPAGNPGRATVSAFAPRPVDEHLGQLIRQASAPAQRSFF
ncbi:DUF3703 domain-containing protein [Polaromonas sp. A23]|uniref:DUF3703 domain-containing protein n=1 Tax=Polaromonas sp. A23 TaxID=1944133 RepID=UPI000987575F|nr:DUF3703 domain-containing protein [Polaromonas sp. A23]OOG46383.1 hypothetical protein B0B52_03250 [Polaromonas sp. A23]